MPTTPRIRPSILFRNIVVLTLTLAGIVALPAAQLKEARVTEVVKDVKLLPTASAPRPAAVSDEVRDGTAVRTGVESRSELKFPDQTLARLGANTVFSFSEGTRSLNLQDGAMLLRVPKG
ncbi:MAG TPA: FecR domain-containing protein, partial [Chthoniobacterales bacterium]|nr:FecR domain-containing protein [Chthoniobacterales bacterium]